MFNEPVIFQPKERDSAMETACQNFIMAGLIRREDVTEYLTQLSLMTDSEIAKQLATSWLVLKNYLAECWNWN